MQRALQHIISTLQRMRGVVRGKGLVLLAAPDTGVQVLEPPAPVPANLYTCGSRFELGPLFDMVASVKAPLVGVVTTDGSVARGWTLRSMQDARRRFEVTNQAAGRTRRGGSSAARIGRIRDDQDLCFWKRVAEAAAQAWLGHDGLPIVASVIVAGPAGSKSLIRDLLPAPLLAVCLPLVTAPDAELSTVWSLSLEHRQKSAAGPCAVLQAKVAHLQATDPDMLVWGTEEIVLAAKSGVLAEALVRCARVYSAPPYNLDVDVGGVWKELETEVYARAGAGAGAGSGSGSGSSEDHRHIDVGILRYRCGSVRDMHA